MNRIKAALIHLLISVVAFSIFLSLVYFIWYASPFYITEGIGNIVYLMAGVDIVLGPLLTLVVFKAAKKGLKFDLTLIGIAQISALIYGAFIIYSERPAWITFANDKFEVVGLSEIDDSKIPDQNLKVGLFDKPKMVYAQIPSGEKLTQMIIDSVLGKKGIDRSPSSYRSFESNKDDVFAAAKDFETHPELKSEPNINGHKWLPVNGKLKSVVVIVDPKSQKIIEYRMINPWLAVQPSEG